ncbi:MAG: hypothetical protein AAF411_07585 [Myxococcota bacterium]
MSSDAVVCNGMHALLAEPSTSDEAQVQALQEAGLANAETLQPKIRQALDDERLRGVANRIEAGRLRNHLGKDAIFVEVPRLETDVNDLKSLAQIAAHLTG